MLKCRVKLKYSQGDSQIFSLNLKFIQADAEVCSLILKYIQGGIKCIQAGT